MPEDRHGTPDLFSAARGAVELPGDWPDALRFPLNRESASVADVVLRDLNASDSPLVVAGYASLARIVDFIASCRAGEIRIVFGSEPFSHRRGSRTVSRKPLPAEMRDYWLDRGFSVLLSRGVLDAIAALRSGRVRARYLARLMGDSKRRDSKRRDNRERDNRERDNKERDNKERGSKERDSREREGRSRRRLFPSRAIRASRAPLRAASGRRASASQCCARKRRARMVRQQSSRRREQACWMSRQGSSPVRSSLPRHRRPTQWMAPRKLTEPRRSRSPPRTALLLCGSTRQSKRV